jgi:hypothetical protein
MDEDDEFGELFGGAAASTPAQTKTTGPAGIAGAG